MSKIRMSDEQRSSFVNTLRFGQYNLLLGAGASMDSHNEHGELPSGERFREELCDIKGIKKGRSLQQVYNLFKNKHEITKHITDRMSGCSPGPSMQALKRFTWNCIYTWNIDDVIENLYKIKSNQKILSVHYSDEYTQTKTSNNLLCVHLHGTVLHPEKGYVFSNTEYAKNIGNLNAWMLVLAQFIQSEPFIVIGASLDEVDLEYYLAARTAETARSDKGPSILVDPDDDEVIRDICERHHLLHFAGTSQEFFDYCASVLPNPPPLLELAPEEERNLLSDKLSEQDRFSFLADFELVPTLPPQAPETLSTRFFYGHLPEWKDLAANYDISREITPKALDWVEGRLANIDPDEPRLLLLSGSAGTGKSTVLRRVGFELAGRGRRVLLCSSDREIAASTARVLSSISGPVILLVDDLANQAASISELMREIEKTDYVVVAAERSYRDAYIHHIIGSENIFTLDEFSMSRPLVNKLIDNYVRHAYVNQRKVAQKQRSFTKSAISDPIAIVCCRIMNDFKPLARIIDNLLGDAKTAEVERYLTVALAQHCFAGGVSFQVLLTACTRKGIRTQFDTSNPLHLAYTSSNMQYVVAGNATLSDQILSRYAKRNKRFLLNIFEALANSIQPYVSRTTIKLRTPESKMAGRLFNYDDVTEKFLGEYAEAFYSVSESSWKWNSRFWEQLALMNLNRFHSHVAEEEKEEALDEAETFARRSVAIEEHPHCWSTLGKVLMTKLTAVPENKTEIFDEAFELLKNAIERERSWSRKAAQPYMSLFHGVHAYRSMNGNLSQKQRAILVSLIKFARKDFRKNQDIQSLVDSISEEVFL